MTYDDDELAEAALLLAYEADRGRMPASLEQKILDQAAVVSAAARFSTTKAASLALEPEVVVPFRRTSPARMWATWTGWAAAAACFAIAVYEWRSHAVLARGGGQPDTAAAAAPGAERSSTIPLRDSNGRTLGEVTWNRAAATGEVSILDIAPNAKGERYELWLSESDAAHATPIGSFVCAEECRGRVFAFPLPAPLESVKRVWVTRGGAPEAPAMEQKGRIVGEGSDATR